MTADIAEAVRGVDLILCPAPAFAQQDIARALAPHLADGQVVFLPPATFGSMIFARAAHEAGNHAAVSFAETGTLPWLARKHGPFEVAITIRAKRLPIGVFPLKSASHALEVIGRAFPGVIEPCGDALSGALMNAGPIIHPPLIVMNAGPMEHFERWDIHKEGTQAAIRRVTDALDAERIAMREALGYGGPHFPLAHHYASEGEQWMYGRGSHDRLTDSGDWREQYRADRASLHARGFAPRSVVPRLGRRTGRRRDAAGAGFSRHRRRHLRRGFHAERTYAREPRPRQPQSRRTAGPAARRLCAMTDARARIVCLGAGRMGRGIAVAFAYAGHAVAMVDVKTRAADQFAALEAEALGEVGKTLRSSARFGLLTENGRRSGHRPGHAWRRRGTCAAVVADAGMVFEGVPEVVDLKREVLAAASKCAGPDVIIASTTSTILVDDLSGAVAHPERFLNVHWLNPAYLIPLVEISPGAATDPAVTARLKALLEGIGKVPVVCAAAPGFIVPRIQALAMNEAARMVEEGVASAEDIDKAIRTASASATRFSACSSSSTGAAATSSTTPAAISKARLETTATAPPK